MSAHDATPSTGFGADFFPQLNLGTAFNNLSLQTPAQQQPAIVAQPTADRPVSITANVVIYLTGPATFMFQNKPESA
jgi:hypothetical protein